MCLHLANSWASDVARPWKSTGQRWLARCGRPVPSSVSSRLNRPCCPQLLESLLWLAGMPVPISCWGIQLWSAISLVWIHHLVRKWACAESLTCQLLLSRTNWGKHFAFNCNWESSWKLESSPWKLFCLDTLSMIPKVCIVMTSCGTTMLKLGTNVKDMFGFLKKETKNNK